MSDQNSHHFIIPAKIYLRTFIALLILTVLTVAASRIDLGWLNTPLALAIALVKMSFVAMFFMGLKWERGINPIMALGSVMAVILFFLLTFADVAFRDDIEKNELHSIKIEGPVKIIKHNHTQSHKSPH